MPADLIDDLRAEIANGHVLVVVGTGVSLAATGGKPDESVASWRGLLEDGLQRCQSICGMPAERADRILGEIRSDDLQDILSAAGKIWFLLDSRNEIDRWLRETVGSLRVKDSSVLEAIRGLGLPIATTNYDDLLEEATGLHEPVTWLDGDRIVRAIRGDEPAIVHLHGHWKRKDSIVLDLLSYQKIRDHGHAQAILRGLRTFHTLLFVGCGEGLSDPNFSALLEWAREVFQDTAGRHYRLCKEDEVAELLARHAKDHLYPIPYGSRHADLGPFLGTLGCHEEGRKRSPAGKAMAVAAHPPRLAGPPARCYGRIDELRALEEYLLQPVPSAVPILGPPGVGKTTLSLEALHKDRIKAKFGDRRFFVPCDGAKSREALLSEIALNVGLDPGPELEQRLFQELERSLAVLALDNAETPWEADMVPVEGLLTQLSTIPGVALVASVRGDQRPFGPRWSEAVRVGPFGLPAARDTFVDIAGGHRSDPRLDVLLEAVDRLPIAVVLMAHLAEGEPDLEGLWKQWQEKRTALLRHADGRERLTNIEVSLDLSINGNRMTPMALRLLAVLALLPDGAARQDLDVLLPGEGEKAASVLRKVGLAFYQGTRLRVLAPVREYVGRRHPPSEEDLDRSVAHFLELGRSGAKLGKMGGAEAASRLAQELGNLERMIERGLGATDPEAAVQAASGFGWFFCATGWGTDSVLRKAVEVARKANRPDLEAACQGQLGGIALFRSDHAGARDRYEQALPLYRNAGDLRGEANCIQCLGDIALYRSDHTGARERYEQALPLHRNVGDVKGEANCIHRLGGIALQRSDHAAARDRFEQALPLYRNVCDVLGEANCIQCLGDIALYRSDHTGARERYEQALSLYRNVGSVQGEANCIQRLGDIALSCSDHGGARERYEQALALYRNVGDVQGEANCIRGLGDIALQCSGPEAAGERFREALELYQRIPEPYSIGRTYQRLARLAPEGSEERREHVRAAREAWESIDRPDLVEELGEEFGE